MRSSICIVVLVFFFVHGMSQDIHINEFMSLNESTIADEDGDYSDWIELYNSGDTYVDLSGWFLSDDIDNPLKWQVSGAGIQANGHLIVFASSKDRTGPGQLHASFKISSSGESLLLSDTQGVLVDMLPPVALNADVSYGSSTDGSSELVFFSEASPGESNSNGIAFPYPPDELTFAIPGGFYDEELSVELVSEQGATIRFTLDGSEPNDDSPVYSEEIIIRDRQGEEDEISLIDTGVIWESPRTIGEKATVIRAASFIDDVRISSVNTETYFISERLDERYSDLPVISLCLPADSLFSYQRGIYVAGENHNDTKPTGSGNYFMTGRDWEREMHFEFFDKDHEKQFEQNIGGRVHGNSSRYHSQKSLRLYARSEYGQSFFDYPFFKDKDIERFKRIILRNSSTDFAGTMFKDNLCAEIIKDMDIDHMAWQTCIVFINGEYWGVHTIRERIDDHFLSGNHGVDPDSVDLLALNALVEEGNATSYFDLLDFVRNHDLRVDENYQYVADRVDLNSYMDYYIAQLYLANYDWPVANIRFWKGHGAQYKWRWIFYDCDRCMVLTEQDHLIDFIQENNQFNFSQEWTFLLFNKLIKNQVFKEEFVQRFFFHLTTTFEGDRVLGKINDMEELYRPLVVEHMNRWNYPSSMNLWNEGVGELKGFVIKRPAVMVQQLMEYIGEQYSLYPNPVLGSAGYVNLDMDYTEGVSTTAQVFNTFGELIYSVGLTPQGATNDPIIPIDRLSPGLYIVRIQYGALVFSEKLMVE